MAKIDNSSPAATIGLEATKLVFILNGGGAVALLALLGSSNAFVAPLLQPIAKSIQLFGFGAALAPIGLALAYWAVHLQSRNASGWGWKTFQFFSILAVGISVVVFLISIITLATQISGT